MFVYELSGCGFKCRCSHLNFKYHTCFDPGIPWHSANYRVQIHSKTCTWHDTNVLCEETNKKERQSNSDQRYHLVPQTGVENQRILEFVLTKDTTHLTRTKNVIFANFLPLMNISMQKSLKYQLITSGDFVNQRILQTKWTRGTPAHTQPETLTLRSYLPLMTDSIKNKRINK